MHWLENAVAQTTGSSLSRALSTRTADLQQLKAAAARTFVEAMADSPDFSRYFGNSKLSDCTVALVEEPPPGCGSAKRRQQELPGHSMVLVAFSGYCKAKASTDTSVICDVIITHAIQQTAASAVPGLWGWFQCKVLTCGQRCIAAAAAPNALLTHAVFFPACIFTA